jgi:hypothetical protein
MKVYTFLHCFERMGDSWTSGVPLDGHVLTYILTWVADENSKLPAPAAPDLADSEPVVPPPRSRAPTKRLRSRAPTKRLIDDGKWHKEKARAKNQALKHWEVCQEIVKLQAHVARVENRFEMRGKEISILTVSLARSSAEVRRLSAKAKRLDAKFATERGVRESGRGTIRPPRAELTSLRSSSTAQELRRKDKEHAQEIAEKEAALAATGPAALGGLAGPVG